LLLKKYSYPKIELKKPGKIMNAEDMPSLLVAQATTAVEECDATAA